MKIAISIALSLAIAVSCKQVSESNGTLNNTLITLDLSDFTSHAVDTSAIRQPHLVNLELTTHSQIRKIQKLVVTEHYIVVLDEPNTQSVFIFDRAGKFLSKIHKPGKGPGEFNFLTDLDVNISEDYLYLLDVGGAKILEFSLTGEFIAENRFGFKTRRFSYMDAGQFVFDQGSRRNPDSEGEFDHRLLGLNFEEKRHQTLVPFTEENYDNPGYFNPEHSLFKSNGKLFYVHPFQYKAYEIVAYDSLVLKYQFDFGSYATPEGFYEPEPDKTAQKLLNAPYVMGISKLYEMRSGAIMFNFTLKSDTYWALYDHHSGNLIIKNTSHVKFTSEGFFLIPKTVFENQLITYFSYDDLLFYEQIGFVKEWSPEDPILNQLKSMGPNSNPVVIIAELK